MRKNILGLTALCALVLLIGLAASARAELNLDFTLVNKTGYPIKELYIGPTSSDDWGDNILNRCLRDHSSINITFSPRARARRWDIKVVYVDQDTAEWHCYRLDEISKITLYYDADKDKTNAKVE